MMQTCAIPKSDFSMTFAESESSESMKNNTLDWFDMLPSFDLMRKQQNKNEQQRNGITICRDEKCLVSQCQKHMCLQIAIRSSSGVICF